MLKKLIKVALVGIAVLALITGIGYLLLSIWFYGSLKGFINQCEYTEEVLPVPWRLRTADIVMVRDMYLGIGNNTDDCTPILNATTLEIIDPSSIDNESIGRSYYEQRGMTVEAFPKGKKFKLVKIIATTKHGLSTIDSGPGPMHNLILQDEQHKLYKISTVYLDNYGERPFFEYYQNQVYKGTLSHEYFNKMFKVNTEPTYE